ncbi:hypothetical protein [Paenibacillus daejeonensis]|uniref:hypothetical protein n=1 Tax=Paenibacillus daejeonensis TaxID=135193 RepID=UPI000379B949|nr:hypothetical protein [Paenibacillus daejeonensis]
MKKKRWIGTTGALLLSLAALLSGCTAQTGTVDEQGLRPHLAVDLQLPAELAPGESGQVTLDVALLGDPITAEVIFAYWPEGEPGNAVEAAASSEDKGRYQTDLVLPEEGIYVVRAQVAADGLEVMPAKWLAIGEDAVRQLAVLEAAQAQEAPAAGGGGHHH